MNRTTFVLFVFCLFIQWQSFGQERIQAVRPNAKAETDYVWMNIRDVSFFDRNNYQVAWPNGELVKELLDKSRANQLSDHDYSRLLNYMNDSVYHGEDYNQALSRIQEQMTLINTALKRWEDLNKTYEVRSYPTYRILLSLYGPGGSYDYQRGQITMFATRDGRFKQYDMPANTIIHEMIHMGIEESIVQELNLPHALKERVVDRIVLILFGDLLKDYRMQQMGYDDLDNYLKTKDDISELNTVLKNYLAGTIRK